MNILCTIPARLGSQRLPRKNLLSLAGKPMIAYSIEAALSSGLFDKAYVCTESSEIADIARNFGAEPVLVPAELCGDLVPSHAPCQWLVNHLREGGEHPEALVCLQPSSPLRTLEDIQNSVAAFQRGNYDFLVSVTSVDPHYFHWVVTRREDGTAGMYFGDTFLKERPLLPPVFRPNGSIKIAKPNRLREVGHFFGPNLGVVETPEERSVHVNNEFDFRLCENLLREAH